MAASSRAAKTRRRSSLARTSARKALRRASARGAKTFRQTVQPLPPPFDQAFSRRVEAEDQRVEPPRCARKLGLRRVAGQQARRLRQIQMALAERGRQARPQFFSSPVQPFGAAWPAAHRRTAGRGRAPASRCAAAPRCGKSRRCDGGPDRPDRSKVRRAPARPFRRRRSASARADRRRDREASSRSHGRSPKSAESGFPPPRAKPLPH